MDRESMAVTKNIIMVKERMEKERDAEAAHGCHPQSECPPAKHAPARPAGPVIWGPDLSFSPWTMLATGTSNNP